MDDQTDNQNPFRLSNSHVMRFGNVKIKVHFRIRALLATAPIHSQGKHTAQIVAQEFARDSGIEPGQQEISPSAGVVQPTEDVVVHALHAAVRPMTTEGAVLPARHASMPPDTSGTEYTSPERPTKMSKKVFRMHSSMSQREKEFYFVN